MKNIYKRFSIVLFVLFKVLLLISAVIYLYEWNVFLHNKKLFQTASEKISKVYDKHRWLEDPSLMDKSQLDIELELLRADACIKYALGNPKYSYLDCDYNIEELKSVLKKYEINDINNYERFTLSPSKPSTEFIVFNISILFLIGFFRFIVLWIMTGKLN